MNSFLSWHYHWTFLRFPLGWWLAVLLVVLYITTGILGWWVLASSVLLPIGDGVLYVLYCMRVNK